MALDAPWVSIPSSSGHQFTAVLDPRRGAARRNVVSIPSSSGHQFTGWGRFCAVFRSWNSFNPFFIRASVYCDPPSKLASEFRDAVSIPSSSGHQFTGGAHFAGGSRNAGRCFNPFFIRASVYCAASGAATLACNCVSIPSSSGHQFTGRTSPAGAAMANCVSIPSSSGHQFTGMQVITVVAGRILAFQSLLHQGISLLAAVLSRS